MVFMFRVCRYTYKSRCVCVTDKRERDRERETHTQTERGGHHTLTTALVSLINCFLDSNSA